MERLGTSAVARLVALAATLALGMTAPAAAASPAPGMRCAEPAAGGDLPAADPAAMGVDGPALQRETESIAQEHRGSYIVYRYGCKVAETYTHGSGIAWESWSAAKSVLSLAVGRAVEQGLITLDDRVGALIPEADAAHGDLTVRQIMQMRTGLHWNLARDYNVFGLDDHVRNALTLPFDHAPGTYFEYAQVPLSLLAEMVTRATGTPFPQYVRREVLTPLGINGAQVGINVDRVGNADAFWGVRTPAASWARIGQAMLQQGVWHGERLFDEDWMAEVPRASPANGCYGLLFWTNAGDTCTNPRVLSRETRSSPYASFAPRDAFRISGLGDQTVWIVPSQGLVVVRFGPETSGAGEALLAASLRAIRTPERLTVEDVPPAAPPVVDGDPNAVTSLLDLESILAFAQVVPPLPPAGPKRARTTQIATRTVRAGDDGGVTLPLRCPPVAQVPCAGTVTLHAGAGKDAVADAPFTVAAGATADVTLRSAALSGIVGDLPTDGRTLRVRTHTRDQAAGVTTDRVVRLRPSAVAARAALRLDRVRVTRRSVRVRASQRSRITVTVHRRRAATKGRRAAWVRVLRRTVRTTKPRQTRTVRWHTRPAGRYRIRIAARARDGSGATRTRTVRRTWR
ncbi:MAG: beta-lactamase family protein [Solirubrobacteraceae bacterium]|nr:beta-lactamase family protein [Solirubrobacteraceae bacterium]